MTFPTFTIGEGLLEQIAALVADVERMKFKLSETQIPLRQALRDVILPSINENFNAGGRPGWRPLAESTVEKRGSATPILQRSGDLRKSATSAANWDVTRDTLQMVGMSVSYGAIHQGGAPRASIPARPFAVFQPEDEVAIEALFGRWIDIIVAETWDTG